MKTLQKKDICGYLPYGLRASHCGSHPFILRGIAGNCVAETTIRMRIEDIKPILRPLSDLSQTISHEGTEIIPIVELAKKCGWSSWALSTDKSRVFDGYYEFYFNGKVGSFFREHGSHDFPVYNQVALFDYMNELKIDYRGLIDAGLAVPVHDFAENPYGLIPLPPAGNSQLSTLNSQLK
jgi:hypothetical protein